jgi:hypothetical protein
VCAIASNDSVLWLGFGYQGGYLDQVWAGPVQYARNVGSRDSVMDSHIQSLSMIGSRLYYGGYRGFGYMDMARPESKCHFIADSGMPYGDVAAIAELDSSRLALGALFGVVEYFPRSDSFAVLPNAAPRRVTCLLRSGDTLWYGSLADGLFAYNLTTKSETLVGLAGRDRVSAILPMPGEPGALLVAMKRGGCHVLQCATGTLQPLQMPSSLFEEGASVYDREILCAAAIGGRVWLGMREAGVAVLQPGRAWVGLTFYDGLPGDEVRAIAESPRHVWVGCYGGLCRFDKDYLETRHFGGTRSERNAS